MTGTNDDQQKRLRSRESAAEGTHDAVFDLLAERVPNGSILDIPCGSGAFLKRLREGNYQTWGADIAPHPALEQDRFKRADMNEPLPFDDASFDAVVSIEGIEHIQRPFDFIRECRRILKPGGCFILTTPNICSLRSRWRWFLTGFHNKCKYPLDETHPQPRHHINMMALPELRYILHTHGLRIEQVATNRIKAASWLYLPAAPIAWAAARVAYPRGAKSPAHSAVIHDTHRQMHSRAVLYGETLILVARAVPAEG